MYQAGIARFDKKSETFQLFALAAEWQSNSAQMGMVTPTHSNVDGKVWTKNNAQNALIRIDLASGKLESLGTPKDPATNRTIFPYGIPADHQNNLYLLDFAGEQIAKVDAKTGAVTAYKTPTANSRPRRGRVDAQDRLWFAEYGGNAIGLFDPKRGSRNGSWRHRGARLTMSCLTITVRSGPAGCSPIAWHDSIRRRARSPSICCHARPTSDASMSTARRHHPLSGLEAITAPQS